MDQPSIEDVAKVSKSFAPLIKRLLDEFGLFVAPHHIKRITNAKNQANLSRAESELEIADLQDRAKRRLEIEDLQHQQNMESILLQALPEIKDDAKPDGTETDWLSKFVGESRHFSDPDMQILWAKILAGEVNTPGSYSKRTLSLVADLSKEEAEMFTRLCRFNIDYLNGIKHPLVLEYKDPMYIDADLTYDNLEHLDSIGLIDFISVGTYLIQDVTPKSFSLRYFDRAVQVTVPDNEKDFETGSVHLTKTGIELERICNAYPVDGFLDYVKGKWNKYYVMI